jgi:hypothetical protein
MADLKVMTVIRTQLAARGNGANEVYRKIVQYWDMDGNLLAEVDPLKSDDPDLRAELIRIGGGDNA